MSSDSYLPDFFTAERLEWYRDLSESFPLWCGLWREELLDFPEAWMWYPDRLIRERLDLVREVIDKDVICTFHESPAKDHVACPLIEWREWVTEAPLDPGDPVQYSGFMNPPPVDGAWFAALDYIGRDWTTDPPTNKSRRRALGHADHHIDAISEVLRRNPVKEPNQIGLRLSTSLHQAGAQGQSIFFKEPGSHT